MMDLAHLRAALRHVALYDMDLSAAKANLALAGAVFSHPGSRTILMSQWCRNWKPRWKERIFRRDLDRARTDRVRYADLEIPARYGVLQTVGDTTGPGGIREPCDRRRSLRILPEDSEDMSGRLGDQLHQPMSVCTASLLRGAPGLKVFGCCHEVFSTQKLLARKVAEWLNVPKPIAKRSFSISPG